MNPMAGTVIPTPGGSPASQATPGIGRMIEKTVQALTSGLGGVAALITALVLVTTQLSSFTQKPLWPSAPPWLGLAGLAGLVLLALIGHTIPQLLLQQRIKSRRHTRNRLLHIAPAR